MGEQHQLNTKVLVRYAVARYKQYQRETTYRLYISEALRIISENTAMALGGGPCIRIGLADILRPAPEDNRTPEEKAQDILDRAGIEVVE